MGVLMGRDAAPQLSGGGGGGGGVTGSQPWTNRPLTPSRDYRYSVSQLQSAFWWSLNSRRRGCSHDDVIIDHKVGAREAGPLIPAPISLAQLKGPKRMCSSTAENSPCRQKAPFPAVMVVKTTASLFKYEQIRM